jgi:hypothetical protein
MSYDEHHAHSLNKIHKQTKYIHATETMETKGMEKLIKCVSLKLFKHNYKNIILKVI